MCYEQQLQKAVLSGAKGFLAELSDIWEAFGLQECEINERLLTLKLRTQNQNL